ncbi:hypothetical protein BH20ACT17_BH20ACT17_16710 [soil metagenome]
MSSSDPPATSSLRAVLEEAMAEEECSMDALTVLANKNDPFRVDTPAGRASATRRD